MAGFGTPRFDSQFKQTKRIPEGGLIARVLPPMGTCQHKGDWSKGHAQHFGYFVPNPTVPGKTVPRTFGCIEESRFDNGEKFVLKRCPECDLIQRRQDEYDAAVAELKKQKKSDEEIEKTLEHVHNWLRSHNRDFKVYINVKDVSGEYYTLGIGSKLAKKLQTMGKTYLQKAQSINIMGVDQGLWLQFTRTGKGFGTEYDVQPVTETRIIDGESFEKVKMAPLVPEESELAYEKCYDLSDVGIRQLTFEKIKALTESHGDPKIIDAVFKSSDRVTRESSPAVEDKGAPDVFVVPDPAPVKVEAPKAAVVAPVVQKTAPVVVAEPEDDEVAKAMAMLKAAQAKKAAKAVVATPAPVAASEAEMTEAEAEAAFLESVRNR